eukprot:scaffold322526_cov28-Prasinocladus_malaysianus.AAC.1
MPILQAQPTEALDGVVDGQRIGHVAIIEPEPRGAEQHGPVVGVVGRPPPPCSPFNRIRVRTRSLSPGHQLPSRRQTHADQNGRRDQHRGQSQG